MQTYLNNKLSILQLLNPSHFNKIGDIILHKREKVISVNKSSIRNKVTQEFLGPRCVTDTVHWQKQRVLPHCVQDHIEQKQHYAEGNHFSSQEASTEEPTHRCKQYQLGYVYPTLILR